MEAKCVDVDSIDFMIDPALLLVWFETLQLCSNPRFRLEAGREHVASNGANLNVEIPVNKGKDSRRDALKQLFTELQCQNKNLVNGLVFEENARTCRIKVLQYCPVSAAELGGALTKLGFRYVRSYPPPLPHPGSTHVAMQ